MCGLLFAGCVSFQHVGESPIEVQIHTRPGRDPVPDVMVWITYEMPGGFFRKAPTKVFGPYISDDRGRIEIPAHRFSMLQLPPDFAGNPRPGFILIHPTRGSCGAYPRPGTLASIAWSDSPNIAYSYRMIDDLPPEAQEVAWRHVSPRFRRAPR